MKNLHAFRLGIFFLVQFYCLNAQETRDSLAPISNPKIFITSHQISIGGKTLTYKATASETYLKNDKGQPVASIWSVAYTQDGIDTAERPVSFVFNGGPGSASVWLHMGLLGPRLVKTPSNADADDGAAPYQMVQNPQSLLDLTDLVFIDPIGTGYSHVVGSGKEKDYWGLMEDARSVAAFMRLWVTDHDRWLSPKYLIGESFGTTRAAAVANVLEGSGQDMALNGLVLISQALDYEGSTSVPDNITSFLTYLPSMAATAWYHHKAGQGKTLEAFVQECREFTYNTYAPALYKGSRLPQEERNQLADRLSYFIGLPADYILKADLKVMVPRFQKQLLADQGLAIGRLDGRFMGDEYDDTADSPHLGDPASYQIGSAYTAALNHYFADNLKVKMDRPYMTSNDKIDHLWKWRPVPEGHSWEPSYVNTAHLLGETMRRNTDMKVMVACGYYDLICPFFDTEYTFARNGIVADRVSLHYFEAGHMMYTHQPDFEKLCLEIREFLTK